MADDKKRDLRLSGPLDMRLANLDFEDRSVPPERNLRASQNSPVSSTQPTTLNKLDQSRFATLIDEFRNLINMPDLELEDPNCCTIEIGDRDDNMLQISIELRAQDRLLLFSTLEVYPNGITDDLAARIELISAAQEGDGYYLSTSAHSVFLCSERELLRTTSSQFGDWVTEFYKQVHNWKARYRNAVGAPVVNNPPEGHAGQMQRRTDTEQPKNISSSLHIPSRGLKV